MNNPTMEFIRVMRLGALGAAFRPGVMRILDSRTSGESTSRRETVTLDVVMGIIARHSVAHALSLWRIGGTSNQTFTS